jgi:hypothetical protein
MFAVIDFVLHRALVPVVRIWAVGRNAELAGIPRPNDLPRAEVLGPDGDRVLILGAGPALGRGVNTHQLALPGALARALTALTGRGTDVDVITDPGFNIRNIGDAVDATTFWRFDAIVLTPGVTDTLAFTSVQVWEKHLVSLLAKLGALAPKMEMFVVGIPPVRSIPGFDTPMGGLVGRHAESIDRVSSAVCSRLSKATFVPLSALPKRSDERHRAPEDYTRWGRELAVIIAPLLDASSVAAGGIDESSPSWLDSPHEGR